MTFLLVAADEILGSKTIMARGRTKKSILQITLKQRGPISVQFYLFSCRSKTVLNLNSLSQLQS